MAKKIALIIAHNGYQQVEYNSPKKLFENAGIMVITASNLPGVAVAKDGSTTKVDITVNELDPADYDGIFFIGGPGALENLDNLTSHALAQKIAKTKKIWGAICISPRILATSGVLTGKKATGWDDDGELADLFKAHGVIYSKQGVVVDGNLITATGPGTALAWAEEILRVMGS